jgi:hypothetical protein
LQSYWNSPEKVQEKKSEKKSSFERQASPLFNNTGDGLGFYLLDFHTLVWYQNNFEPEDYNSCLFQFVCVFFFFCFFNGSSQKTDYQVVMDSLLKAKVTVCTIFCFRS